MNKNTYIVGGLILLALVAGIFAYTKSTPPTNSTDTPSTTTSPTTPTATSTGVTPADPKDGPTTTLSPYTVYIGFATKYGTSSEAVLKQPVNKVVVGYEWEAIFPSPMFDSVKLPQWDANAAKKYEVYLWATSTKSYELFGDYRSAEEIQFPRDGLNGPTRFKVLGIDPALKICPGDRTFNWSVRFSIGGTVGLVRTPITKDLPFGQTCVMR